MSAGAPLPRLARAWRTMTAAIREDHDVLRHYDAKYDAERAERVGAAGLARDAVTRVGFQMVVAYRAMRFCVDAGIPLAPQVASRLIRHLYGAEIHWEATLDPGVVIVHGTGLVVSRAAKVERGAILFQNVTLGMSVDATSRASGAPHVERDAHIGAGSVLVGPITIGARSKVTANCFVRSSVPPDSLVEAPVPTVASRASAARDSKTGATP